MNWIFEPWPWYIGGPAIGIFMLVLLSMGKQFGMSSNLRTICSIAGAGKVTKFFNFNWKAQRWNLTLMIGAALGGFIAANYLSANTVQINESLLPQLQAYGINSAGKAYLPTEIFAVENLHLKNILILLGGGLLVGFGARYAGGCTSGHGISGLSNLQLPSLIAIVGFFIGGLVMIHLFYPLIF
ncbi:YeeE/YedE family protein [Mesonia aestuariivivens]|uniref:YeeE/YedE family protein n=1 Tax=Mesonia aestuariivivens TaxID=2796128 RepID=A0ABS6W2V1_9FLAO|nr:YeeE/YedE thiosulfate transporter family protein [Mesonia aestuariivivens]MBW2961468.1 YeeE/YedE family protein [Mesonia aestuariivivens]